jgi:hypothetical protein
MRPCEGRDVGAAVSDAPLATEDRRVPMTLGNVQHWEDKMAFAGFDRSGYPGDMIMTTLKNTTNLVFCGYYFPAPSHSDPSWLGKRSFVQSLGFGIAPIYVGEQVEGPGSHHPSREKGTIDGNDAARQMESEGFAPGSCVYLDLENGPPLQPIQADYVNSWCDAVQGAGFFPGVYCSHLLAAPINAQQATARIWAVKVTTTAPHPVAGPPYPEVNPGIGSGFPAAALVQLHQNCQIRVAGLAKPLTVDLDSAAMPNPGAPASEVA